MSRLQTELDELPILEQQCSRDWKYVIDNTVQSDIPYVRLSGPKPAGPREHIVGEIGEQHQGLLRVQVLFASPGEEQTTLIGFDFVFNSCTIVIQIAQMHAIIIP